MLFAIIAVGLAAVSPVSAGLNQHRVDRRSNEMLVSARSGVGWGPRSGFAGRGRVCIRPAGRMPTRSALRAILVSALQTPAALLEAARLQEQNIEYPKDRQVLLELFASTGITHEELIEGHWLAGAIEPVSENNTEARLHFLYALRRRPDDVVAADAPLKGRDFFELVS